MDVTLLKQKFGITLALITFRVANRSVKIFSFILFIWRDTEQQGHVRTQYKKYMHYYYRFWTGTEQNDGVVQVLYFK